MDNDIFNQSAAQQRAAYLKMSPEELKRIVSSLDSNEAPGVGVFAVWQRLKLTFGDRCSFNIESEQDVGTTVRIRIPYAPETEAQL